jgi:hypothetical protein
LIRLSVVPSAAAGFAPFPFTPRRVDPSFLQKANDKNLLPSLFSPLGALSMTPETMQATAIMETFIREADGREPHCAVDSLLGVAERMERQQGGRLTEFQVRVFAAFLLGAARLPPDVTDPDVVPEWLSPDDAQLYADGAALVPPDARSPALTAH